ncbi:MAG TPA: acyltransferase domain-containing protein [Chitinophagaceae bacterium]|nr:acyltransferase domain-containing protein [Chitinophagaceae bacterium]
MSRNHPIGVSDIVIGPGGATSLKRFWSCCLSNDHSYDGAAVMEAADLDSWVNNLVKKAEVEHPQVWYIGPGLAIPALHHEHINIEHTTANFLKKTEAGVKNLQGNRIDDLIVGALERSSSGNFEMAYIAFSRNDKNPDNCFYAELESICGLDVSLDSLEPYHKDNLHEWTVAAGCERSGEALLTQARPGRSFDSYCALGFNVVGHEAFHWLLSIARTVLALHHRIYPPGNSSVAEGLIPPGDYIIYGEGSPWICPPEVTPSASCFIYEESSFSAIQLCETTTSGKPRLFSSPFGLFVFSAGEKKDLAVLMSEFLTRINELDYASIQDFSVELNRRPPGRLRVAVVASGKQDLIEKLEKALNGSLKNDRSPARIKKGVVWNTSGVLEPKIAAVYPGQGGQRVNMLKVLCLRFPNVREWFDNLEDVLVKVNGILPSLTLFPPAGGLTADDREKLMANLNSQEGGNVAVIIASIALDELLRSLDCGINVMMGHSSGEISAMIISGVLKFTSKADLFKTILLVTQKGAQGNSRGEIPKGKFLAVTTSNEHTLDAFIEKYKGIVYLAMDNCHHQKILFFPDDRFEALQAELNELGVICFTLSFDRAYHTPLFESEMDSIRGIYNSFTFHPPQIPLYSCIGLDYFPPEPGIIKEWAELNWTNCVRFKQACEQLYEDGVKIFLEMGPGAVLSGFIADTLQSKQHKVLPIEQEGTDSYYQLLNVLANLFVEGVNIDFAKLFAGELQATTTDDRVDRVVEQKMEVHRNKMARITPAVDHLPPPTDKNNVIKHTHLSRQSKSALMQDHFALMNAFLETEKNVLGRLFKANGRTMMHQRPQPPSFYSNGVSKTNRDQAKSLLSLPLIDAVVMEEGDACICQRTIDRKHDLFLQHHTFGRFILKKPIDAEPLPIVPLAMTIEMMAEAASLLAPDGFVVTEILNIHALKWIAVERESLVLLSEAKVMTSSTEKERRIFVKIVEKGKSNQPLCTATVVLSARHSSSPKPMPFTASNPESVLWDAESFFEQCLFHGEAFSCMDELLRTGQEEIEVRLSVPPKDNLFLDEVSPQFMTPAQLLDVPGHAVAYWLVEGGDKFFGVYPVSIASIRFYGKPKEPFSKLTGRAKSKKDGVFFDVDFEALDQDETVCMKISGFKLIYYRMEQSFLRSHYWTGPNTFYCNELSISNPDIIGFEANKLTQRGMEQSNSIWTRTLVHMYCNSKEKNAWNLLPANEKRKTEWLLGRIAAKEIVRKWALNYHSVYILCPDIEIDYDTDGRPHVISPELMHYGPLPDISISHSGGQAVAVAASPGYRVGVDLERFDHHKHQELERLNKHLQIAFGEEELEQLTENGDADLYPLVCAKEAAAKVVGKGFLGRMKSWKIKENSAHMVRIGVMEEHVNVHIDQSEGRIMAYCIIPLQKAEDIHTKIEMAELNTENL